MKPSRASQLTVFLVGAVTALGPAAAVMFA